MQANGKTSENKSLSEVGKTGREHTSGNIKSRGSAKPVTASIFRADLLIKNPAVKRGFLFTDYGFGDDAYIHKLYVIETWHKLLSKHEGYKPPMVEEHFSCDEILNILRYESNRLFKGYQWKLYMPDEQREDPRLAYFKAFGEPEWTMMPLDWIHRHPDPIVRVQGMEVIRRVADHFGIDAIKNPNTDYELCEWSTEEELKEYLIDNRGYNEDEDYQAIHDLYWSYNHGEINDLCNSFVSHNIGRHPIDDLKKIKDKEIRKWLLEGVKLLQLPSVCLGRYAFDRNPGDDHTSVVLTEVVFFPFSLKDPIYESAEQLLDDMAGNEGVDSIYEWGQLSDKGHEAPVKFAPMAECLKFIRKGYLIYNERFHKTDY